MKRALWGLIAALALWCAASCALGEEARDITGECKFKVSYAKFKYTQMTDKKYTTHWESNQAKQPWVQLTAPEGTPIQGLYICFAEMPERWELQVPGRGGAWVTAVEGDTRFMHVWVPLPEPAAKVRLAVTQEGKYTLCINELFALSEGEVPDWVQQWEPTEEKADILFLATHPDDELIFFAGAIPTYAAERGKRVVVAYFSRSNIARQSELLNGLWSMGVRHYPLWGAFRDHYPKSVDEAFRSAGGKDEVMGWVTSLYRRFRPEVVVSQDVNGEYGHPQHKMIAQAAQSCVAYAADETMFPDSLADYGAWQVKKLYLHLWPENQIVFDWTVPLASMGGKSGIELATYAYTLHKTQAASGMSVTETGTEYDNRVFGLAFTTVGEDEQKNDFLEHIPLE